MMGIHWYVVNKTANHVSYLEINPDDAIKTTRWLCFYTQKLTVLFLCLFQWQFTLYQLYSSPKDVLLNCIAKCHSDH